MPAIPAGAGIFLNRLKKHKGVRGCWNLFNNAYLWLSENEELRKYDGQDYTATKWAGFNRMLYGLGIVNILEDMKVGAPSKIHNIQLVKIQPEERLAATSELNL